MYAFAIVLASGSGGALTPQRQEGRVRAAGPQAGRFQFQLISLKFLGEKMHENTPKHTFRQGRFSPAESASSFTTLNSCQVKTLVSGGSLAWNYLDLRLKMGWGCFKTVDAKLTPPIIFPLCDGLVGKVLNIKKPPSDGWWAARWVEEKQLAGGWC